jgi:hypothetical protein
MQSEDRAIHAQTSYPLASFAKLSGLGKAGIRSARRAGLPIRYVGNKPFVLGSDWLTWLATRPTTAPSARTATAAD